MKSKLFFWVAAAFAALSVMAAIIGIKLSEKPEFVPPEFEENAKTGFPSVNEEFGFADADINGFEVYVCSKISVENGKAKVFFTNGEENNVWAKIRVIGEERNVIGESGLLNPGEYAEEVALTYIPEKGSKIKIKVMLYEPETYRSEGAVFLEAEII